MNNMDRETNRVKGSEKVDPGNPSLNNRKTGRHFFSPGGKNIIWKIIAFAFVLLCVLTWLDEIWDIPHFILGAPASPVNWHEAFGETSIIAIVGIFTLLIIRSQIAKQKQAEQALKESEDRYRTIFESANDIILLFDNTGKVLDVNNQITILGGYQREEFIGKNITALNRMIPENSITIIVKNFQDRMAGKDNPPYEFEFIRKTGEAATFEVKAVAIEKNGKVVGDLAILRDVSERKKIERMKDNLIRDVSHELKTPVAMMEMAYNISRKSVKNRDQDGINEGLSIISDSVKKLRQDIDVILDFSSLDERKPGLIMEKISLRELIDEILSIQKYLIDRKKLRLKIGISDDADYLATDRRSLKLILSNIINNAVKFTEQGGISITAGLKEQWREIKVTDTGCGIAPVDKGKIFDKFYQRHPAVPGVGLGLTISRVSVERLGGKIKVDSEGPGQGTTVTIMLLGENKTHIA